jgi:hypothetical protein
MSQLRYREFLALLRHPLVPLDADVEVVVNGEAKPVVLGMVGDLLNKAYEFSEERLDSWLTDAGIQYRASVNVGCVRYTLRMSDPL